MIALRVTSPAEEEGAEKEGTAEVIGLETPYVAASVEVGPHSIKQNWHRCHPW